MASASSPDPLLIEIVSGEQSFWDSSFWTGLLPILGVLAGALVAHFLARTQEKKRTAHETRTRWDERILDATSAVMSKLDEYARVATRNENSRIDRKKLIEDGVLKDDAEETLNDIHGVATTFEAYQAVSRELARLELIAPQEVRDITAGIYPVMRRALLASGEQEVLHETLTLEDQRDTLEDAVRKHFGLKTLERPTGGRS